MDALKRLALRSIAGGLRLPEAQIGRFHELTHLKRLLEQLDVNVVVDAGANVGQFAGEVRALGFGGLLLSFEPVARVFSALQDAFSGDANWRGFWCALGAEEREAEIHIPRLTVLSSLLRPVAEPDVEKQVVPVRRLDAMLDAVEGMPAKSRVFLKMDTQGYDLEVFKGAAGWCDRIVGLQSELSVQPLYAGMPGYLEALSTYEQAGFRLSNLSAVSRDTSGGLIELNCLMRRKGTP